MKQELFNFLDSQKIPKDQELDTRINELKEYFDEWIAIHPENDLYKLCNTEDKEIIVPLIVLSNPYKLKEILNNINKYPDLFPKNVCGQVLAELFLYFNIEEFQETISDCMSSNFIRAFKAVSNLTEILLAVGLDPTKSEILTFLRKNPQAKKDLKDTFINYSAKYHNVGIDFLDAIETFKKTSEFNYEKEMLNGLPRNMKREFKKFLGLPKSSRDTFILEIRDFYAFINSKYNEIVRNYEKDERKRKKHNDNIEELKKLLNTDNEIKNIDAILKLCSSDEIKEAVVDYIITHNKKIYESLVNDYDKARLNSEENLNNLFTKYGFDYTILSIEDKINLKEMAFNDIENLLKRLSALKVFKINVSRVSLFKLSVVEDLRQKGIITEEWLINNESLLLSDNTELEMVVTNIDLLSKEGINMLQYSNSLDITKSENLKENLYLLRLYGCSITKTTTDLNFLSASDLRLRIEFIYSLGLYQDLTDLNILNNTLENLLRMKIANSLNIPVESISDLSDIYCDFTSEIIPQNISEKLAQDSLFIVDIPAFLEQYRENNAILNINGIYVSSEKIKRNLAKIGDNSPESCFYAIIYNGYYTYEELETLRISLIPERFLFNQVRS